MSDVAELETPVTSTAIALVVSQTPVVVLTDSKRREEFYAHIQAEADALVADISTTKGRDEIKALAYKITRTKTAIDAAGKELNEEARSKINAVDAERRAARDHLDALAKKVRQPLTDWEAAEDARVEKCDAIFATLKAARFVSMDETSEQIRARGNDIHGLAIDEAVFQGRFDEATREKADTIAHLAAAMNRVAKEEADRAELEKLRRENEERERAEAAQRAADEAEARRVEQERQAEATRAAAEKAEQERMARAEQDAADRARREAEQAAEAERAEDRRQHEAALAAERDAREKAEREAQAERDRIAAEEQARVDEAARVAAADAERQANQAHRTAIKTAAKEAIIAVGIPEAKAIKLVQAIVAGDIPAVTLAF